MKQKLLSVTVASVLGLGVTGHAVAQEGVKAFISVDVENFLVVNPADGEVIVATGAVSGSGSNTGALNLVPATQGLWNTIAGVPNGEQACISDNPNIVAPSGVPGDSPDDLQLPPCPGEDAFSQVQTFPDDEHDFGRSDSATAPGVPGTTNGDDVVLTAGCQLSDKGGFQTAQGATVGSAPAVEFQVNTATQTLDLAGGSSVSVYSGNSEARVTAGLAAPPSGAKASNTLTVLVERVGDNDTVTCDVDGSVISSEATNAGETDTDEIDTPNVRMVCDAADPTNGFDNAPFEFQPNVEYTISSTFSAVADCTLSPGPGDGFKWYLAKRTESPRLPNPIVEDLVITDQFGTQTVDVRQLVELINPAVKNQDGPPQDTDHLTCYNLRRQSADVIVPGRVRITTDNFGVEDVRLTRGPKELCGPAIKNGESGPDNTYYTCYVANGGQPQGAVTVSDQFFTQRPHQLSGMSRVCTPAGLNGAPPPPPTDNDHLACYEFASQPRLPRQDPFLPTVDDPFIPDPGVTVTVERENRWCERATKELL